MVRPSSLTLWTTSNSLPLTTIGSKTAGCLAKEILSSLHLPEFKWTLFSRDHWITWSAIFWALLTLSLGTISDVVVSSTYFQTYGSPISKSLIIIINNQGPSLVPCGTPEGTDPHSEKQPSTNLILWNLSVRTSIIQLMALRGRSNLHNFVNKNTMIDKIKCFTIVK